MRKSRKTPQPFICAKRCLVLTFCLAMLTLLCSACGESNVVVSTESESSSISASESGFPSEEAEANEISDSETAEAETIGNISSEEDLFFDVNNLSQEQKDMIYPLDVAAFAGTLDDDIWRPLLILFETTYYDEFLVEEKGIASLTDLGLAVPKNSVLELASVFDPDFDGYLPSLPTNEVSDLASYSYQDGDLYYFAQGDMGEDSYYAFRITSWVQHANGNCTVEGVRDYYTVSSGSGDTVYPSIDITYHYELTENEYTSNYTNPLFSYSIISVEEIDGFLLPDSDSRYYGEDELSSWTQETLRYARNEIYARHGYIFESEDLQDYFESQSWYEGTIQSSDFDYDILNAYEKANIEMIKSLEEGTFSFSDIDNTRFWFSSGVGAWSTYFTVYADGSFEGTFYDSDAGQRSYCDFSGTFSNPSRIDKYTCSATIDSLEYLSAVGSEEMIDDILYIYTSPYGVEEGDEVLIYLPGMRLIDLPDIALGWNMDLYLDKYYDRDDYSAQVSRSDLTEDMILQKYIIWDTNDENGGFFWQGS